MNGLVFYKIEFKSKEKFVQKVIVIILAFLILSSAAMAKEVVIGEGNEELIFPFSHDKPYHHSAAIYLADEIGEQGNITQIQLNCTKANRHVNLECEIFAKSIQQTTFDSSKWNDLIPGAELVYAGNHNFSATGWHTFDLDDYYYDGSDHLLLMFYSFANDTTNNPKIQWETSETPATLFYCKAGTTTNNPNLNARLQRPNIILTIQDINTPTISIIMDEQNMPKIMWDSVENAVGYNIYSSAEPHNGEDGWMLLDTVSEPGYTYEGADDKRFFSRTCARFS